MKLWLLKPMQTSGYGEDVEEDQVLKHTLIVIFIILIM